MANGFPNDICLLLLSTPSTKTPATLRCSPSFTANCNDDPAVGSTATMIGWGATSGGSPLPGILQQAEITVMSQSDLEQRYIIYGSNTISDSHLGLYNGTVSACIGDSGGPVMGLQQGEKKNGYSTRFPVGVFKIVHRVGQQCAHGSAPSVLG
jgi:trypsin